MAGDPPKAVDLSTIWGHLIQRNVIEDLGAWHFYDGLEDIRGYVSDQLNDRPTISDEE